MAWDNVPWFVGGGAQHSPEVARLVPYALSGRAEGIVDPTDLKVQPLAVPGTSVRVSPGAALIRERTSGATNQTYVARMATEDVVPITATGSGSGRRDLIVARVEDPYVAGAPWDDPVDPTVGPYVYTRVIPNVPASAIASNLAATQYLRTLNMSAIPLAAIDLPASTGTVQASHIKDLRSVAIPNRERILRTHALVGAESDPLTKFATPSNERWPDVAFTIEVPEWATVAQVQATWSGVYIPPGNATGYLFALIGYGETPDARTQEVKFDTPNDTNAARAVFMVSDDIAIPANLRGKTLTCELVARAETGTQAMQPILDAASAISFDVMFSERPE